MILLQTPSSKWAARVVYVVFVLKLLFADAILAYESAGEATGATLALAI